MSKPPGVRRLWSARARIELVLHQDNRFSLLVSKNLREPTGLPVAPYAGASYGTYDDKVRVIGGLGVFLTEKFSALVTYNGVNVHPVLTFTHERHAFSLIMVKGRDPGVSYSVTF
ncbi:MAG TPA: hypothetical protein VJ023_17295 [Pyrinomonadaceae bacterium]|nr:hypothetical protein [Pyrinomonadaceae bacterium]